MILEEILESMKKKVGKDNIADFTMEDIKTISDEEELSEYFYTPEVIEKLVDETNDEVSALLEPIEIAAYYDKTLGEVEEELQKYELDKNYKDELLCQMKSKFEKDNVFEVLASGVVLMSYDEKFDGEQHKQTLKESLEKVEDIVVELPLPESFMLIYGILTNLYLPVISIYQNKFGETLIKENKEFISKLEEFAKLQEQIEREAAEEIISEGVEKEQEEKEEGEK